MALAIGGSSPLGVMTIKANRIRKRDVHFSSVAGILGICVALVCRGVAGMRIGFSFLNANCQAGAIHCWTGPTYRAHLFWQLCHLSVIDCLSWLTVHVVFLTSIMVYHY